MFKLEMDTSNAAFQDFPGGEIAALLRIVGERLTNGSQGGAIFDINGNRVGRFFFEE